MNFPEFSEYHTDVPDCMRLNLKSIKKRQEEHHDLETRKANFINDLWVREKAVMKITKYLDLRTNVKEPCHTLCHVINTYIYIHTYT